MRRSSFHFADMMRCMVAVAAVLMLFVASVHVIDNGLATPAVASTGVEVGAVHKKSNGIGFVLMVSLQRG